MLQLNQKSRDVSQMKVPCLHPPSVGQREHVETALFLSGPELHCFTSWSKNIPHKDDVILKDRIAIDEILLPAFDYPIYPCIERPQQG